MVFWIALALGAACAAPSTRIGLALGVPEGGGEEEYLRALRQQIRLGLDAGNLSLKWDEFEAQGGKPLEDGLGVARVAGQRLVLTIATIDTVRRRLPKDVEGLAWDDPRLVERFEAFLGKVLARAKPHVSWLSLGNEVDPYLASHPDEVEPYLRFLARARQVVRRLAPGTAVGVTVICRDSQKGPDLARRLQAGMDVTIATYYPLDGFRPTVGSVDQDFAFLLRLAGDRPLVLQEVGCPSSPLVGSSEDLQAGFVRSVFEQLALHGGRIPAAVFFAQTDFPSSLLGVLEGYYGIRDERFRAFLGSLGFLDAKGRPKKAWRVFAENMARLRPVGGEGL